MSSSFPFKKLKNLLEKYNLMVRKSFSQDGYCMFVQCYDYINQNDIYIYIPSKYNFKVDSNDILNFELSYIDIDDSGKYLSSEIDKEYEKNINDVNNTESVEEIKNQINSNYKKDIDFEKVSINDKNDIQIIYKQLKRLKYSVRNLKFKIIIIQGRFFCYITRNNDLECMIIKKYMISNNNKKFYLFIDLENLYKYGVDIFKQQIKIFNSIYNILNDTYKINLKNINDLLSISGNINHFSNIITNTLYNINNNIDKLNQYLIYINKAEEDINKKILNSKSSLGKSYNINNDIHIQNKIISFTNEKNSIKKNKTDIIKTLFNFNKQKMNIILEVDCIYYENQLYLLELSKNFKKLQNIF